MRKIKLFLVIGILVSFLASFLEVIFEKVIVDSMSFSAMFFYISLLGQGIFLLGLFLLDRRAKSLLSGYYATMICICVILYFLPKSDENNLVILIISAFFFFLLFFYLRIWTRISGNSLFIYSFYVFILCLVCGIFVLKMGLIEGRASASFIIVFIIAPALIMYITAIFSLKNITFDRMDKVIV